MKKVIFCKIFKWKFNHFIYCVITHSKKCWLCAFLSRSESLLCFKSSILAKHSLLLEHYIRYSSQIKTNFFFHIKYLQCISNTNHKPSKKNQKKSERMMKKKNENVKRKERKSLSIHPHKSAFMEKIHVDWAIDKTLLNLYMYIQTHTHTPKKKMNI